MGDIEDLNEMKIKPLDGIQFTEPELVNLIENNYFLFGITVSPCSTKYKLKFKNKPQVLTEYALAMEYLYDLKIIDLHYEYKWERIIGKYPHIHFTVVSKDKKLKLIQKGLSIKINPIYNYIGWVNYCKKDELPSDYPFI